MDQPRSPVSIPRSLFMLVALLAGMTLLLLAIEKLKVNTRTAIERHQADAVEANEKLKMDAKRAALESVRGKISSSTYEKMKKELEGKK